MDHSHSYPNLYSANICNIIDAVCLKMFCAFFSPTKTNPSPAYKDISLIIKKYQDKLHKHKDSHKNSPNPKITLRYSGKALMYSKSSGLVDGIVINDTESLITYYSEDCAYFTAEWGVEHEILYALAYRFFLKTMTTNPIYLNQRFEYEEFFQEFISQSTKHSLTKPAGNVISNLEMYDLAIVATETVSSHNTRASRYILE
jgi:hypothetical protein